jgi:hypothetical protein
MNDRTADEAENRYTEKMGAALGTQFYALWKEVVWLHWNWGEFVELFGSKPTRIELLNEAAPAFFRVIQDALWELTVLHIARLTDTPKSRGRPNLTIRNLPDLVDDAAAKHAVAALIDTAVSKASFCRDWRNRHLAHRDLDLALNNRAAAPLEFASRERVKEALAAIAKVLNYLDGHYMDSETYFGGGPGIRNGVSLLHVLDAGLRAERGRAERLERGEFTEEDFPRDL